MLTSFRKFCVAASLITLAGPSLAVSTDGAGSIVVVPLFGQTGLFTSIVTIFNPNAAAINIFPSYVGMDGRATVGKITCPTFSLAANTSVEKTLLELCPPTPGGLVSGSNNGKLTLAEITLESLPFFAYSRQQNNAGTGFSVEGFPIGTFEGGPGTATGLRRITSASPVYQSNCAVASMGEAAGYRIEVQNSSGALIGNALTGSLSANQMIAFIDIFAAVNAPAGDILNARAVITNPTNTAALLSFCTIQDGSLAADFRIAKTFNPEDESRQRFNTVGTTRLGQTFQINNAANKNTHVVYFRHPDVVSCYFGTDPAATNPNLKMRFVNPNGVEVLTGVDAFQNVPVGGDGGSNFLKSTVNAGVNGRWLIEVATETAGTGVPQAYTLTCRSGNGHTMLDLIDSALPRF